MITLYCSGWIGEQRSEGFTITKHDMRSMMCRYLQKGMTITNLSICASAGFQAASGTSYDAAPAFVQLGVMGADVAPHVPQ